METLNRISKFEPSLLNAFDKMVRGINIELTKEFREKTIKRLKNSRQDESLSRWWFIQSIGADETLNLCSSNHSIMEGIRISECVL